MKNWYYQIDHENFGPVNEMEFRELVKIGKITGDTIIWESSGERNVANETVIFQSSFVKSLPTSKTWAIVSMLLGIFACMLMCMGPFLGIAALITGFKSINLISQKKASGLPYAIIGICSACLSFLILCIIHYYAFTHHRYPITDPKELCIKNMIQIGFALKNYSVDNGGYYPPEDGAAGLEFLRKGKYLSYLKPGVLACPDSKTKSVSNDVEIIDKNISYVYKGGQKNTPECFDTPILWDKDGNHKDYGNILYGDGRVEPVKGANWKDKLK